MSLNISFIGAGNLATHLTKALSNSGYNITQVYSRTEKSAKSLAKTISTKYTISLNQIDKNADIYFIALKDSVVDEVLGQIDFNNKLIVHCSGSLPLSILKKYSKNIGVFYPLQTFTKGRKLDFNSIPIFVESNSKENQQLLLNLATNISDLVSVLNSEKRKTLHVSAVIACNFTNYMYSVADEVLGFENISFDVLRPLILETALKIQEMKPKEAQTGPAVRFDENIINSHLQKLEGLKNYQELYKSISKGIFELHKK